MSIKNNNIIGKYEKLYNGLNKIGRNITTQLPIPPIRMSIMLVDIKLALIKARDKERHEIERWAPSGIPFYAYT